MHLVLTDVLTCPKCGPTAGLIVLADRIERRRILEGKLGCAACQTNYPVRDGVADLRVKNRDLTRTEPLAYAGDPMRLAALMGITEGRGFSLILGPATQVSERITAMVPNLQLVAVEPGPRTPEAEGVSPVLVDSGLPLTGGSMRAVVLTGDVTAEVLRECARVAAGGARVVIESDVVSREAVEASGLRVLAAEGNTIVATRAM